MKSLLLLLSSLCISFSVTSQTLEIRNPSGVRMSVDADDRNPALIIVVPDGPEGARSSKILFPEHVTVRAHGQSDQEHLYIFRTGTQGYSPEWEKTDNTLEYGRDFGRIRLVARATLKDDGIKGRRHRFPLRVCKPFRTDYDILTAITDPRFQAVFYDPRLQRTYVHHKNGFDLLASETPARLTIPLKDWFPARYLASYTVPVPKERVQHRDDGITYYYKSRPVDVPMIATVSEDRTWVAASFARSRKCLE
jgi:hypothetical protein